MTNSKRNRITIKKTTPLWLSIYQPDGRAMPAGAEMIGVICLSNPQIPDGLLLYFAATDTYKRWDGASLSSLQQDKAKAAHAQLKNG